MKGAKGVKEAKKKEGAPFNSLIEPQGFMAISLQVSLLDFFKQVARLVAFAIWAKRHQGIDRWG